MAGHSHWAGIKHKKGKADKQRSKIFSKLSKEITVAAKLGDKDPAMNPRLRSAVQAARSANMPKDNIERAIKKASEKSTDNFKEILLEGYAPHGIAILVEAATDNNNRTVANIRSYFNKCDGNLATSGSVEFLFNHLCFFQIKNAGIDTEELELDLIDFGIVDFNSQNDEINITANFEDFGSLQKEIERRGLDIISSEFEREAINVKSIKEDQKIVVDKLINLIDEDDDVQNVYHDMG